MHYTHAVLPRYSAPSIQTSMFLHLRMYYYKPFTSSQILCWQATESYRHGGMSSRQTTGGMNHGRGTAFCRVDFVDRDKTP